MGHSAPRYFPSLGFIKIFLKYFLEMAVFKNAMVSFLLLLIGTTLASGFWSSSAEPEERCDGQWRGDPDSQCQSASDTGCCNEETKMSCDCEENGIQCTKISTGKRNKQ